MSTNELKRVTVVVVWNRRTRQACADGWYVLISTSTGIRKVDQWSGKIEWSFHPTMDIVSIATEGDAVYVVLELLEPTSLVKLDGRRGTKDWTFSVNGVPIVGEVKVHDDAVCMSWHWMKHKHLIWSNCIMATRKPMMKCSSFKQVALFTTKLGESYDMW